MRAGRNGQASGVTEREPKVLDKTEQQDLSAKKVDVKVNGSLSKKPAKV
ncbi:MAG: hypothetical protein ABFD04_06005 [Syntrophomonas sp.]